jgi:hypothetical protein
MEGPITVEKLSSESEKDTVQNVTKSRLSPQNNMSETEFKESEVTRDKALAIDDIIDNFELEDESKVIEDCNKPAELMDEKEQDSEGYIDDFEEEDEEANDDDEYVQPYLNKGENIVNNLYYVE